MPIENAATEWPEDDSPYRLVAKLFFPPQEAFTEERRSFVDEDLSFCPAHSLEAHRLLGSVGRARLHIYEVMAAGRRRDNGRRVVEPRTLEELPA